MRLGLLIACGAVSLLGACATTPSSPTAGPGPQDADPVLAAQIFNDMCLSQQPDFSGTAQAAAGYDFTINSQFGTYYHNSQNLSVKLLGSPPNTCSIVLGGTAESAELFLAFGATLNMIAPDDDSTVEVGASRGLDGKNYLNAKLSSLQ